MTLGEMREALKAAGYLPPRISQLTRQACLELGLEPMDGRCLLPSPAYEPYGEYVPAYVASYPLSSPAYTPWREEDASETARRAAR